MRFFHCHKSNLQQSAGKQSLPILARLFIQAAKTLINVNRLKSTATWMGRSFKIYIMNDHGYSKPSMLISFSDIKRRWRFEHLLFHLFRTRPHWLSTYRQRRLSINTVDYQRWRQRTLSVSMPTMTLWCCYLWLQEYVILKFVAYLKRQAASNS